jgi:hypothetical protein
MVPRQEEIDPAPRDLEIEDCLFEQRGRTEGVRKNRAVEETTDAQAQARLVQQTDRCGLPSLWRASDRVRDWSDAWTMREAAEQLGHPIEVEVQSGFERAGAQPRRRLDLAITGEPQAISVLSTPVLSSGRISPAPCHRTRAAVRFR